MKRPFLYLVACPVIFLALPGCIHDHPKGETVNPENVNVELEIRFQLNWSQMLHQVDFNTKAREDGRHKFIIEAICDGVSRCRDEVFLTDEYFSQGSMTHTFSRPLTAELYQVAVWYEKTFPETGSQYFHTGDLSSLELLTTTTTHGDSIQCGYATERLDLRNVTESGVRADAVRTIELLHPGARFQIVATDIREFIEENRGYLLQGDSFFVNLSFSQNRHSVFNLYAGNVAVSGERLERKGELWLPFADYDELKIADGYIFIDDDDYVTMTLTVTNTSGMVITRTQPFSFPARRGYITTLRGDFLSFPINGAFTVNPNWDGEIEYEL